jgi:O-antigen/teichoic acid export membrane protein
MIWRRLFGYLPASLTGGLTSFGAVFIYTRLLGPSDYGFYALAMTAMGVIYTLAITWAEAAAYRFAGEAAARGAMPNHIRTVLALVGASSAVGVALMLAGLPFASPALRFALAGAAAVTMLQPIINTAQEMSRAQGHVSRWCAVKMTQDIGSFLIGSLLAWRSGFGAASPFIGLACVLVVLSICEGSRLGAESRGGNFQRADVKRYAAYGIPVALSLVLNIALDTGDRFLIAFILGPEAVGVYAAGYGVVDKTLGLICAWAAMAGAPMMLQAWEREGPEAMRQVSAHVARTLLLVAAPAATGLALVARPLSEVMIGEALRDQAAHIMPWIALSGLTNGFVLYFFSEAFQLSRRTDLRARLMAIPALANVALNLILLPRIGLMGAVYATLACYALALVLLASVGRRLAPLAWPWADFIKVAAACGVMTLGLMALPAVGGFAELAMKASVGAMLYAATILAFDTAGARGALQDLLARRLRQACLARSGRTETRA